MNRRGQIGEVLQWLVRLGAAILLVAVLVAQILMITGTKERPDAMELALYEARLLGPDGLGLEQGRLDIARFTGKTLMEAYGQANDIYGARISLYDDAQALAAGTPSTTIEHERQTVLDAYLALGQARVHGSGGAIYERHVLPVIVTEGAQERQAWLSIEAVKRT